MEGSPEITLKLSCEEEEKEEELSKKGQGNVARRDKEQNLKMKM